MSVQYPMKLVFSLEEPNDSKTNVFIVEDDVQWTTLIVKFADFLSSHYGYDVKEKIAFINDYIIDEYSVVGERTISNDAYSVAKSFDKERNETPPWEDDEE